MLKEWEGEKAIEIRKKAEIWIEKRAPSRPV